ncbi:MAG: phage holin family protein [Bacteroidales bacterium]|nr:phage holin family protein [Bacteroidales bacterium]
MASLKSGIDKLSGDSKTLVEDYVKLFSIKQSEKLALLLGILFSFFMLSLLLLIVILFSSFALAAWLNSILSGAYTGFLIMGGLYVLLTILLLLRIIISKTPFMANFFSRLIAGILGVKHDGTNDLKGLRHSSEMIQQKIDSGQDLIKADLQLLRYSIFENILKEILGLFSGRQKESKSKEAKPVRKTKQKAKKEQTKDSF